MLTISFALTWWELVFTFPYISFRFRWHFTVQRMIHEVSLSLVESPFSRQSTIRARLGTTGLMHKTKRNKIFGACSGVQGDMLFSLQKLYYLRPVRKELEKEACGAASHRRGTCSSGLDFCEDGYTWYGWCAHSSMYGSWCHAHVKKAGNHMKNRVLSPYGATFGVHDILQDPYGRGRGKLCLRNVKWWKWRLKRAQ